ncbi:MAG TPA: M23 family metallopeptidase [Micromonosporaceae bacterium]|nr:M23 family metallopeptidase [Micromonosporaceae bacterium]
MRQRLSSEPDRYRGRRRVPTPPRSRYAAVVTTAFVGAGVVALGAGAALPDAKTVSPTALADLEDAAKTSRDLAARADDAQRASRDASRSALDLEADEAWVLPLEDYTFTTPYGMVSGKLHSGIDLAVAEGTPYKSIYAGTVTRAGWYGGYGYCVIVQHADGTETIYGHASELLVAEGQQVKAGDVLGLTGNTGHSYGSQLYLEVHVDGQPIDPVPWLRGQGVDLKLKVAAIL